ncbi:MAG TPA: phospholipid carrier-dependent glycosyltransferase [Streptosporangiaceae bacterium]
MTAPSAPRTPRTWAAPRAWPAAVRRWPQRLRPHWVIIALLVLAAALRVAVLFAYRPALIFPDSHRYLQFSQHFINGHWVPDTLRPSGYSILLIPVTRSHVLALAPIVQHLIGLAEGTMVYAVLMRHGARRWLAALAAIPVLFDPLQLILEQYILSDVFAMFFVFTALVVLAWNGRRAGPAAAAVSGLLLGAAGVTRIADLALIVPALLYLCVAVRPWRRLAVVAPVLALCFLIPVGTYAGWFDATRNRVGLTLNNGTFLYSRVVQFADCAGMHVPALERPLCPAQPPGQRNADFYTWSPSSPQWTMPVPPGMDRQSVVLDFGLQVIAHQPMTYLKTVGHDVAYGFSAVRGDGPERYPVAYLQFDKQFRPYWEVDYSLRVYGHTKPVVQPGLAGFVGRYGQFVYTPGPILAAAFLLGLAGMVGTRRSRRSPESRGSGQRSGAFLFLAFTATALVAAAVTATFDWRYQIPQLTLIPVAAGLGVASLAGWRRPSPAEEPAVSAAPTTAGVPDTTAR